MSQAADLAKLAALANLMLDHRLSALHAAARKKQQSEAALCALDQNPVESADFQGASVALAALTYQRWADARRGEINQTLARQTLDWMEARDHARLAFGKAEAIKALQSKPPRR